MSLKGRATKVFAFAKTLFRYPHSLTIKSGQWIVVFCKAKNAPHEEDNGMVNERHFQIEGKTLKSAINLNAFPPPTAQTSLRWRQDASAERMRNPLAG
jgi:hypothetical protein